MRGTKVQETVLTDVEDEFAPPSMPVLSVCVIDDVAHLDIAEWTEDAESRTVRKIASVAVERSALVNALNVAALTDKHALWRNKREASR